MQQQAGQVICHSIYSRTVRSQLLWYIWFLHGQSGQKSSVPYMLLAAITAHKPDQTAKRTTRSESLTVLICTVLQVVLHSSSCWCMSQQLSRLLAGCQIDEAVANNFHSPAPCPHIQYTWGLLHTARSIIFATRKTNFQPTFSNNGCLLFKSRTADMSNYLCRQKLSTETSKL